MFVRTVSMVRFLDNDGARSRKGACTGARLKRHSINAFVIVTLVVVTFCGSLGNGFVWDDVPVVSENPLFHGSGHLFQLLVAEDTIPGSGSATGYYRPLTYLSFYADSLLWGLSPAGFHFTNLVLHIAVALTLYALLFSLTSATLPALLGTLLFALNPVTAEAVCFIAGGRNTLLCALFSLLGLVMHRKGRIGLAVLCILGAAAAKEPGLLMPVALFGHDIFLARKRMSQQAYLLYLLPVILLLTLRWLIISSGADLPQLTASTFFLAPEVALRYLAGVLLPFFHQTAYTIGGSRYLSFFSLLVFAVFALVAARTYNIWKNRVEAFGMFWFLLFLLPVLMLATLYKIPMADRHVYLPSLGIFIILTIWTGRLPNRLQLMLLIPLIVIYSGFSITATGVWHDNGSLFRRMVHDAPLKETGYTNLARHYLQSGNLAEAMTWLERGESAGAVSGRVATNIRLNMLTSHGESLAEAGKSAEAERLFRQALRLNPDFVPALIDLGGLSARNGDPESAIRYFQRAAELQPVNPVPHFNLAEIYRIRGDMRSADKELQEFRRLGGTE